jgi:hypothetical protein
VNRWYKPITAAAHIAIQIGGTIGLDHRTPSAGIGFCRRTVGCIIGAYIFKTGIMMAPGNNRYRNDLFKTKIL